MKAWLPLFIPDLYFRDLCVARLTCTFVCECRVMYLCEYIYEVCVCVCTGRFKWYKDMQLLDYCHKSMLRVPSARSPDSGQYSCSISNIHGSLLTTPTLVRVVQARGM